jgi:hypothetical protein
MPCGWGGERRGAGRPRIAGRRPPVAHRLRPNHTGRFPVHVTLRARTGLPSLRGTRVFDAVRDAIAVASGEQFRVVHFSVQHDHVHSIVEADDRRSLSLGIRGLVIRLARAVNRVVGRTGASGPIDIMRGRCALPSKPATPCST